MTSQDSGWFGKELPLVTLVSSDFAFAGHRLRRQQTSYK